MDTSGDAVDEPDWYPPPARDSWRRWEPRVAQTLILNAVGISLALVPYLAGLISRKTMTWLLLCESPALLLTWTGLLTYFFIRSRESPETVSDRGRMLVLSFDVMTAIFVVIGAGFWLAILTK